MTPEDIPTVKKTREWQDVPNFIGSFSAEDVALMYHVPYWLVVHAPRPSWFRRPVWRFRAWRWSREAS